MKTTWGSQRSSSYEIAIIPLSARRLVSRSCLSCQAGDCPRQKQLRQSLQLPIITNGKLQVSCRHRQSYLPFPGSHVQPLRALHSTVPSAGEMMSTADWRPQSSAGWARCCDLLSHTHCATGTTGYQA